MPPLAQTTFWQLPWARSREEEDLLRLSSTPSKAEMPSTHWEVFHSEDPCNQLDKHTILWRDYKLLSGREKRSIALPNAFLTYRRCCRRRRVELLLTRSAHLKSNERTSAVSLCSGRTWTRAWIEIIIRSIRAATRVVKSFEERTFDADARWTAVHRVANSWRREKRTKSIDWRTRGTLRHGAFVCTWPSGQVQMTFWTFSVDWKHW